MSDGISDMLIEQERINGEIFGRFLFTHNPMEGHDYLKIDFETFICWDYDNEYWYLEIDGDELKIYPKSIDDITAIIKTLT